MTTETMELSMPPAPANGVRAAPPPSPDAEGGLVQQLAMRILQSPDAGVETIREVLKMQNEQEDRLRRQEVEDREYAARKVFMSAFARAKAEMPQVLKDAYNDQTKSDYATMEAIDQAISPVMAKFGFFMSFEEGSQPRDEEHLHIVAVLGHEDGHERRYNVQVPIAGIGTKGTRMMTTTHGYGATKTYGRRYAKLDVWDIAVMGKDSDGNVNNLSDAAADYLDEISVTKTRAKLEEISAKISADRNLVGQDLSRVRKAWTAALKVVDAREGAAE